MFANEEGKGGREGAQGGGGCEGWAPRGGAARAPPSAAAPAWLGSGAVSLPKLLSTRCALPVTQGIQSGRSAHLSPRDPNSSLHRYWLHGPQREDTQGTQVSWVLTRPGVCVLTGRLQLHQSEAYRQGRLSPGFQPKHVLW